MHRPKQVRQWMKSSTAKVWQQIHPLMIKVTSLLEKTKSWQPQGLIPHVGTLLGAVAFGLWWRSSAAALFAGIGLFFLAGIYSTSERMLATIRRSESEPRIRDVGARTLAEQASKTSDELNQAIESLQPWLANEVSLTEENAKECCAVLLDSVAVRARRATNNL